MAMIKRFPIGLHFPTQEPFLFCAHHKDFYPLGNSSLGVDEGELRGRNIGSDFEALNGFRMYHGDKIPGFPVHPHRGFETITLVRKGYVDHADSLGAAGRYGEGDIQWMTAGNGVQHSEMFPLLHPDKPNTAELFQIWLNLPKKSKKVPAHFTMFWSEAIPRVSLEDGAVEVQIIAGSLNGKSGLPPPPDSWAASSENQVNVWLVKMKSGSHFRIPEAQNTTRSLYLFEGSQLVISSEELKASSGCFLNGTQELELQAKEDVEFLFLEACPMNEPIAQHGPFVMNTPQEIQETILDYRKSHFGGWPWPRPDMVHGNKIERFAKFPDGRIERPTQSMI